MIVSSLATNGCSQRPKGRPGRAAVSGSVTYKGAPVRAGVVTFTSAKDSTQTASCILQSDGTYSVSDAPIGDVQVTVDTKAILGGAPDRYVEIPAKYTAAQSSGLTYTIEEGKNENVDFSLQ